MKSYIQVYGWVDPGGNLSTNTRTSGGNAPAAYSYNPNTVQLDQAVVYIERLPDTVQKGSRRLGLPASRRSTARTIATRRPMGCSAVSF